jgi:cytidylate kinase
LKDEKRGYEHMAVITISRQFGAGGTTLGERLAKRLEYRYVNDELIKEVAKKTGASPNQVRSFEKRGTSKLMKLLDQIISPDFIDRHASSGGRGHLDQTCYVDEVSAILQKLWDQGDVVIIGRGGNYALRDYQSTFHVLLVADMEYRIRFLSDKYGLKRREAEKAVRRADMIRKRFLDCFSEEASHDDPNLYSIVLNMNHMTMDKAEELVVRLVS